MRKLDIRNERFLQGLRLMMMVFVLMPGLSATLRAQDEPATLADSDHSPYHVALLNYKSGHYDEALTAINTAENEKPGDLATELLKGRILTEQHNFADGEKLLRSLLTPTGSLDVQLALADLLLRKGDFNGASKFYDQALQAKPNDSDITLKLIYARVAASDLLTAEKYASRLKPLDPDHPSYYFAKAAIAQATGKSQEADDEIDTVRTIYGITVTNRYLRTYLEVFAPSGKSTASTQPSATNAPPTGAKP